MRLQYVSRHVYVYVPSHRGSGWSNGCSRVFYHIFGWKLYSTVFQVMNFLELFNEFILFYLLVTHEIFEEFFQILILLKRLLMWRIFVFYLQVPEGYSGEGDEAHRCFHLGGFAPHWSWHWISGNGCLDPTYPESHDFYHGGRPYYLRDSKFSAFLYKWQPSNVWSYMVPFRYNEKPRLRADQHITGNSVCSSTVCFILFGTECYLHQTRTIG
jgi:hypothetical protein